MAEAGLLHVRSGGKMQPQLAWQLGPAQDAFVPRYLQRRVTNQPRLQASPTEVFLTLLRWANMSHVPEIFIPGARGTFPHPDRGWVFTH